MAVKSTGLHDPDLVVALARKTLESEAPEELPIFEATSRAFVADRSVSSSAQR